MDSHTMRFLHAVAGALAIVLALSVSALANYAGHELTPTAAVSGPAVGPLHEEDEGWACWAMGNRRCSTVALDGH